MIEKKTKHGLVVLVGAGAGDEDLITLAGRRWLTLGDTVVYDRLAGEGLISHCRQGAELIYVGKSPEKVARTQEQINDLLVEKCLAGRLVVRLKGGDPLIFARGGEEARALRKAGCDFRIVPGVTSALAAAACAGIGLTDREFASTVTFVTGHEDPEKGESSVNYDALAGLDTLVFYMSVGNLDKIVRRLQLAGRPGKTPVAIIERAASARQKTIVATLETITAEAARAGVKPPAIVIVGRVVEMREQMNWFEKLPLFGKTVLVTRSRGHASRLSRRLSELGAEAIEMPTIEIAPPEDFRAMDDALVRAGQYDWMVFTSPNGVAAVFERFVALGLDARALGGVKIAAVGSATADALADRSIRSDLIPEKYTTASLADALCSLEPPSRKRILLARADIASPTLAEKLFAAGSQVDEVTVYRTGCPKSLPQQALDALQTGRVDWITFTSSSTVKNFLALIGNDIDLSNIKLAAIGPVTADTLRAANIQPTITAAPHTIDALVDAIVNWK